MNVINKIFRIVISCILGFFTTCTVYFVLNVPSPIWPTKVEIGGDPTGPIVFSWRERPAEREVNPPPRSLPEGP